MLKKGNLSLLVLVAGLMALNSLAIGADPESIDTVRSKVLVSKSISAAETDIINQFIADYLYDMLDAVDFSEMLAIRASISARKGPVEPSKYSMAFNTALKKNLQAVTQEISSWDANDRKTQIEANLVILAAETRSTDLVDYGLSMIGHENMIVRYWAVKCVTSEQILKTLNSTITRDEDLARKIVSQLNGRLKNETHAEVITLIATFAGQLNIPEAGQLLNSIADIRLKAYEGWSVGYELMDSDLLLQLAKKIGETKSDTEKALFARRFAQLYSYVIQRYILGADMLSQPSKGRLVSVMAHVESNAISKILGRKQELIKKALERNSMPQLQKEHDVLLGTQSRAGRLNSELKFNYGKDATGKVRNAPKQLTSPPIPDEDTQGL